MLPFKLRALRDFTEIEAAQRADQGAGKSAKTASSFCCAIK
jgi:hypothetical protein